LGETEIDIALYAEVLRRHRTIMVVGVVLTLVLAALSYVRVSPSGISYRKPESWSNQATLVLTQKGAPELRALGPSLADTGRFSSLTDVYATLATSDAVVSKLEQRGLLNAKDMQDGALPIAAAGVPSTVGVPTPLMTITALSDSGPNATKLTLAATRAFLEVLNARQLAAKIPLKDRVQVRVVKSSEAPKLVASRSKALPFIVLLGGLIATVAVAVTRDNVARRGKAPELTTVTSSDEPDVSVGVPGARPTPRPASRSDPSTPRGDTGPAIGVSRGLSTLGSARHADSPSALERKPPDEASGSFVEASQ
jgi:hypothetical protein